MIGTENQIGFKGSDLTKQERGTVVHPLFITNSPEMNELLGTVKKFAMSEAPVLITGESGVGKEVIARFIHEYSTRSQEAFIAINSCAFPIELFESELFGHEKGAFTGAVSLKEGCFEQADHGTLFLDEIGEMPLQLQAKVLRAVELNSFRRVGGREISVDVRIVAATNKILMEKVEDKSFREDLYHRLNVLELYIPPLRHRINDIPVLIEHFLDRCKVKYGRPDAFFSDETIEVLKNYRWPGNVRELKNIVERCLIIGQNEELDPSLLPAHLLKEAENGHATEKEMVFKIPIGSTLQEIERDVILQTLINVGNNKTKAAKILGLTRKTLSSKLQK